VDDSGTFPHDGSGAGSYGGRVSIALLAVTLDVADPPAAARFWSGLLDRDATPDGDGLLLPGPAAEVGLRLAPITDPPSGRDLHLHLTSRDDTDQAATVARAVALGGRHVDVGQRPDEGHVVLAAPGDTLFCVIEPGNGFLAGCGQLAELACDGTREVGVFWSAALGWPLVWDRDGETAVQSPLGGTKVAWGGPPVEPKDGRNRQRLELLADDLDGDVTTLVGLGARVRHRGTDTVELLDPDGNELVVRGR
jgi:hypothetical protein